MTENGHIFRKIYQAFPIIYLFFTSHELPPRLLILFKSDKLPTSHFSTLHTAKAEWPSSRRGFFVRLVARSLRHHNLPTVSWRVRTASFSTGSKEEQSEGKIWTFSTVLQLHRQHYGNLEFCIIEDLKRLQRILDLINMLQSRYK